MENITFWDTLLYFSEKMGAHVPHPEELEKGIDLAIDGQIVSSFSTPSGGIILQRTLGLMLHPIHLERLKELCSSNFIGVNTGGCTLALDEAGIRVFLRVVTTAGTTAHENWEWLHRLLTVGNEWAKVLALWEEFVPLISTPIPMEKPLMRGLKA